MDTSNLKSPFGRLPEDKSFSETEASLLKAGRIEELIRLYESRAIELSLNGAAGIWLAKAGQLAKDRLKNLGRAEDLLRRALSIMPHNKEALIALRSLYDQKQDAGASAEILRTLGGCTQGKESADWYLQAADLFDQKLNRREWAILCLQSATQADPTQRAPFSRIRSIYLGEGRYSAAFDSMEREASILAYQGKRDQMAETYLDFSQEVSDDPFAHDLAKAALEKARALSPQSPRLEAITQNIQRLELTWRDRARTMRSASLEERDRRKAARISLSVAKLFAFYDGLDSPKAREALDRSFLLWPAMPQALQQVDQIMQRSQNYSQSIDWLEKMATEGREKVATSELWTRLGTWKLIQLNDRSGALRAFETATSIDPALPSAANLAAELLLEAGQFESAVSLWERHLIQLKDREMKYALHLRLAGLYQTLLSNPDASRHHLEQSLRVNPYSAPVAFQLAQQLLEEGLTEAIDPLWDLCLSAPVSVGERVALCTLASTQYEAKGELARSFLCLSRALLLDPSDSQLLGKVSEKGTAAHLEAELAVTLRRTARVAPFPSCIQIWKQLAALLQGALRRPDEAKVAWTEVLARNPTDAEGLAGLEALKRQPAIPADQVESSSSLPTQKDRLQDLQQRLSATPNDAGLLRQKAALEVGLAAWTAAVDTFKLLIEILPTAEERTEPLLKLAKIWAEKLGDPAPAVKIYAQLLELDAPPPLAASALERLAAQGVRAREAAQALAKHYQRKEDYPRQVASLLLYLSTTQSIPEQQVTLSTIARIHEERLADSRAALGFWMRALALAPSDEGSVVECIRLANALAAHNEVSRALVHFAQLPQHETHSEALFFRAALIAEEGGDIEEALRVLRTAQQKHPNSPQTLMTLAEMFRKTDRLAECDSVLQKGFELAPIEDKPAVCLRRVAVNVEMKRWAEASSLLLNGIAAGAREEDHLPQLTELLEKAGRTEELAKTLERRVTIAQEKGNLDEASRLELKRARVLEASSGDRSVAIKNYAKVLSQRVSDPDALAALETLLRDPERSLEAARALAPAYGTLKDYRRQVEILKLIAEKSVDLNERLEALKSAAQAYAQHLRQPELAFGTLLIAFRLSPLDLPLRASVRRAAEDADDLPTFVGAMTEVIQEHPPQATVSLHRELADIFEKTLSSREASIVHWKAALAEEPQHLDTLKSLNRLYRASGDWSALVEVAETMAVVVSDPSERIVHWRDATILYEQKLDHPEKAAVAWRKIAEQDPSDREAAIALDRLYTHLDRPQDLEFALKLRRAQEGQSPHERELAYRQAQQRQNQFNDLAGALGIYQQILSADPGHLATRQALDAVARTALPESSQAMEILDPVLKKSGDHLQRAQLREARVDQASSEERFRLFSEIRSLYEDDLKRTDLAFMSTLKAFSSGLNREELRPELERLARVVGSFDEVADIYEEAISQLPEGHPDALSLMRRSAELRQSLGQVDAATALWKELLGYVPSDRDVLSNLSALYEKAQNAKSLSEIYSRQAHLEQSPSARLSLLLKSAAAFAEAGEEEKSIEAYRQALAVQVNEEALRALDRLYGNQRRLLEQADVLEQWASLTETVKEKIELWQRRAQLLEKEERTAEAFEVYARILQLVPSEPMGIAGLERLLLLPLLSDSVKRSVGDLLEPIYRRANELKLLVEILDLQLQFASAEGRLTLLAEIANLREALGQKALAFAARARAFAEDPGDALAREELERVAAVTGNFEELSAIYQDVLEQYPDSSFSADAWRRLAVLYADRLARPDLAVNALEEVLTRHPTDRLALDALAQLHVKSNGWLELVSVLRRQINLETSKALQVQLLVELVRVGSENLADRNLTIWGYQEILSRQPDDSEALATLGQLFLEGERYADLASLLYQEIQLAEAKGANEEALELMVRLGRLKINRLQDVPTGLELYREALSRRPNHPGAIGALEELALSENPLRGEAAALLEPLFERSGDYLKWVQILDASAAASPLPPQRGAFLRKMAEVYGGPLANAEMAFLSATRALREAPDDPSSLELCLQFAEPAGSMDELLVLLEEAAEKAASVAARATLHRTLARVLAGQEKAAEAVAQWKQVLALAPSDPEALEQLGSLLGSQQKLSELFDILKRQLAVAEEPAAQVALLLKIGTLQADNLQDASGALATFRRLNELKPNDLTVLRQLTELCDRQERWPELADVLTQRLAARDPPRIELTFRLAKVKEIHLKDWVGALELYQSVLAEQPDHPGALIQLEKWMLSDPDNVEVSNALMMAYRLNQSFHKLVNTLELRVAVARDSSERKRHLLELAGLRKTAGEAEFAYLALYRATKEDPNDAEVLRSLEEAAHQANSFDELSGAYEEIIPQIVSAPAAAGVCLRLGRLLEQYLLDYERSFFFYEKARTLDQGVGQDALVPLDRLYSQLDRPEALANVLESLAESSETLKEKASLYFRLGQLAGERLGRPEQAIWAFEKLLALDPDSLAAYQQLEKIYEDSRQLDKLFSVLKHQADRISGSERERVLTKMASVSGDGLSDVARSIALYQEILDKNPRNTEAFSEVSRLLENAQRFNDLRDVLLSKLAVSSDAREIVSLNHRIGTLTYDRLGQPEEAIAYFKAALDRDARHRDSLEALRVLFIELNRNDDLIGVLRRLIPLQEGPEGVKAIRIQLAQILGPMGRREESLDMARRSLEIEPHYISELNSVFQVFYDLKVYADALRTLELRANVESQLEEQDQVIATLFEISLLWTEEAQKPESAASPLERILELDPSNRTAFEQVTGLYRKLNDWRSYAQVLERYLPNRVTDEEKIASLKELALVQEKKLGQKGVAFLAVCRALQLNPSDPELQEQVERLAEDTHSYEELAAVYEEVADSVPKGPLAEHLYLVLAKVHDEKLDDADQAEAALRKILEFDSTSQQALESLANLFSRRHRDQDYVVALELRLQTVGTPEERKQMLGEIARVYQEQLGEPKKAIQALQRALELESDPKTVLDLLDLLRKTGEFNLLVNTLARVRDLSPTLEERASLQMEIAKVYQRDLRDDEAAVTAFGQVLEYDGFHSDALNSLEQLHTTLDRPAELLSVYQRQLESPLEYRDRIKILFKSAAVWEDRFDNLDHADAYIAAVLAIDSQNIQAIKSLERLRRARGDGDGLIWALDQHRQQVSSLAEQSDLWVAMGDVFHQQLKQVDRAVNAYQSAIELNPQSRPALHALGLLYERSGNWPFALETLQREIQATGAIADSVELNFRMGKISEDMLNDPSSAKASYLAAVKIYPSYLPAIRALKQIYAGEKDYESYEKSLIQQAQETDESDAKGAACLEVAEYFQNQKQDSESAAAWFERALNLLPESIEAAKPLSDVYIARQDWAKAIQMAQIVVSQAERRLAKDENAELKAELCRHLYRQGYVSDKLSRSADALNCYQRAYHLDSTYLPVLEGLAAQLIRAKKFDEALKIYQSLLIHHRDELSDLEVVEIYWQIGDVYQTLQQPDRAESSFEKALSLDGNHEASLRAMVNLSDAKEKFTRSAVYRRKLLGILEGNPKLGMAIELGMIAREKMKDPALAIEAYSAALEIDPSALATLEALHQLFRETQQGQRAHAVLEKMLTRPSLINDSFKHKRVLFALGEAARDEMLDVNRALQSFNAALDIDPRYAEAFAAVETILTAGKKWKQLEENYLRMIQRLPKSDESHAFRMLLWKALGDLYAKVLKRPQEALSAYQVVAKGSPDDAAALEAYAELAARQPGNEAAAIDANRKAMARTENPGKVASAIAQLAAQQKLYDLAYLSAQVVALSTGEVGESEREILAKLTPYAKKRETAQKVLTEGLWKEHLFHPLNRGPLADLLAILFRQAGGLYSVSLGEYQLNPKKHRIDLASAQEYQLHHYRYAAYFLGMGALEVYSPFLFSTRERLAKKSNEAPPDNNLGIEICHTSPSCLKIGGRFFSESARPEVLYSLGRAMASLKPELVLAQRLTLERLEAVVSAAVSLSAPDAVHKLSAQAQAERRQLDRTLSDLAKTQLANVVKAYLKSGQPSGVLQFHQAVELTGMRTGAFLAGELESVKKSILDEQGAPFKISTQSKLRALMVFAVSEDLQALRLAVGTNVEVQVRK